MPRPKIRTEELRSTVLEATRVLLESEGVAACTTRRIARMAGTSPAALYEFFGDKEGLLRAVFFQGFRDLGALLTSPPSTANPRADLVATLHRFRTFALAHPALSELMFSRPFPAFDPNKEEQEAGDVVRRCIVGHVELCLEANLLTGDAIDIAHTLLGLAIGLAVQERAGWLGSSTASRTRRWSLGVDALLDGHSPRDP